MALSRSRALGLLGAAPALALPRLARAQAATTLRIGWTKSEIGAQPYYAVQEGFLSRNGLTGELSEFPNSQAQSTAAAAGSIDLAAADMIQLASAYLHGVPFAFFAGAAIYTSANPLLQLLVTKESPIRKASDLEGQTVAVIALNSISAISVQEWLRVNGADVSKVKIFEMPFPLMGPALQRGTVAAALFSEPFLTRALPECRVLGNTYDTVAKAFYVTAWFGTRDWLTKDRDVARRFTKAIYETARWQNTHHDETAVLLSEQTKVPVETIKAMHRTTFATSLDPKLIQPVLDIAARYKVIDRPVSAAQIMAPVQG